MKSSILVTALLIFVPTAVAQPLIWVSPDWAEGESASGNKNVIFDVLNAIYAPYGYQILHQQLPVKRAEQMLESGDAHIVGAALPSTRFAIPHYPIINHSELVMYRRHKVEQLHNAESLRGLFGVWPAVHSDALAAQYPFLDGIAVDSSAEAFSLLVAGNRPVDYYIDTGTRMAATMERSMNRYEPGDFAIRQLVEQPHYILFARTTEGVLLRKLFENGIEKLYCAGTLVEIYEAWSAPMPDISPPC